MGLFEKIFPNRESNKAASAKSSFETLTAYRPAFTNWSGAIYENELVRAAVDSKARQIAKLKVELHGAAQPRLRTRVKHKPNDYMTWSQFLYRVATILELQNNCFILPMVDRYGNLTGYFPALPSNCKVVDYNGKAWLRYQFSTGKVGAVEFERCGLLTKFQYKDDFFGENNTALVKTMELLDMQNQGMKEAIRHSGVIAFSAQLTNFKNEEDLAAERKAFAETNFGGENGDNFWLFPSTYKDIKQVEMSQYTIEPEHIAIIQNNVFNYFGVNERILQGNANSDELDAFYESVVEPFAIQLSEVMTSMTFSNDEQSYGSHVYVGANRLNYMKTSDKVQLIKELGDRGFITVNEARELLNYEPIDGGDVRPARGEYYYQDNEGNVTGKNVPQETEEQEEPADAN